MPLNFSIRDSGSRALPIRASGVTLGVCLTFGCNPILGIDPGRLASDSSDAGSAASGGGTTSNPGGRGGGAPTIGSGGVVEPAASGGFSAAGTSDSGGGAAHSTWGGTPASGTTASGSDSGGAATSTTGGALANGGSDSGGAATSTTGGTLANGGSDSGGAALSGASGATATSTSWGGSGGGNGIGGIAGSSGITGSSGTTSSVSAAGASSAGGTVSTAGNASAAAGVTVGAGASSQAGTASGNGCPTCNLGMLGVANTPLVGKQDGGRPFYDLCPQGHALVGLIVQFRTRDSGTARHFGGVRAICAPLTLQGSAIVVKDNQPWLPGRGYWVSNATSTTIHCADQQVVTSFRGAALQDPESPAALAFGCSTLAVPDSMPPFTANIATGSETALVGQIYPELLTVSAECRPGYVARGLAIRAGAWVDSIALICGVPALTRPNGESCTAGFECTSGNCQGTCRPSQCPTVDGCSCSLLDARSFMICPTLATKAAATEACTKVGRVLEYAETAQELGLVSTALYMQGAGRFWQALYGTAAGWYQDGSSIQITRPDASIIDNYWASPDAGDLSGGKTCAMVDNGQFQSQKCDEQLPFVCE